MKALRPLLLAALCVVVASAAARTAMGDEPIAVLRGGERVAAKLTSLNAEGKAELTATDGKRSLPASDIIRWGAPVEPKRGAMAYFRDGGAVAVESFSLTNRAAILESPALGRLALPAGALAGVALNLPTRLADRDALANRLTLIDLDGPGGDAPPIRESDEIWFENGDELSGEIAAIDDMRVTLRTESGEVRVEIARLQAIAFAIARPAAPAVEGAWVGFDDGSLLFISRANIKGTSVELFRGGQATGSTSLESFTFYQPQSPGITYLSDLEPVGFRHVPFLDLGWPYRADRNVAGGRLRTGGKVRVKGVGMHSASRITYRLEKTFQRFAADLALDDSAGGRGSVVFRVLADGKQLFKSDVIRGGEPPVPISIDVAGVRQLSLLVEFADRGDEHDRADWLDARLEE